MSNYSESIEYFNNTLEVYKNIHGSENNLNFAKTFNNIGNLHKKMLNSEEALKFYLRAFETVKNSENNDYNNK